MCERKPTTTTKFVKQFMYEDDYYDHDDDVNAKKTKKYKKKIVKARIKK